MGCCTEYAVRFPGGTRGTYLRQIMRLHGSVVTGAGAGAVAGCWCYPTLLRVYELRRRKCGCNGNEASLRFKAPVATLRTPRARQKALPGLPIVDAGYLDIGVEGFSIHADARDVPADWISVPAGLKHVPADVAALDTDCLAVSAGYRYIPVD